MIDWTDWTVKDGRCNTSDKFNQIVEEVSETIRSGGVTLLTQGPKSVASTIVAKLAHNYGMAPKNPALELELFQRSKILRDALKQIGEGMPGASEDTLRLAAQDALTKLADREVKWGG
jgi:hypothetical protein